MVEDAKGAGLSGHKAVIRLGVTMGDPAGVGPEILLDAARQVPPGAELVVFGDEPLLKELARQRGQELLLRVYQGRVELGGGFTRGAWNETAAQASIAYLQEAVRAWENGVIDALVTGPIHKRSLAFCGQRGPGQTEWLAQRLGVELPVMAFWSPSFWVVLATKHLPLRLVPAALDRRLLLETVRLAYRALRRFLAPGVPRLALAALNPHGEEDGRLGGEEGDLLRPVVEKLVEEGISIEGPLPADSVFFRARRGEFDAVVALYHDQGLGPLKTLHFSEAVHLTLGLPLVRTSPDHGVAYELAGSFSADATSMREALRLAVRLVEANT